LLDFYTPKITFEQVTDNRGIFVVEPLDRGFGHTFGNSLRRVLLSSLEGAAISAVKIDGVAHEFSTIENVKEDVTDLILNLKKAVFVLHGEDNEVDVTLSKEGPGEVTVGDIDAPANLEIVNPGTHVATLGERGRLSMTLWVRRGRGYVSADDNRREDAVLDVIPIDSIFSPVSRVSYKVDAARVGQRTDYDRLTLEVETNGALDPRECMTKAADLLIQQLAIFADGDRLREKDSGDGFWPDSEREGDVKDDHLDDILIEELELGVRSYNCLKREGVETVGDLVARSEAELLNIPNFGRKSIDEVRERLAERDLKLRGE
jgi:DNA-directed RNA polymerase subunit alpha